MSISHEPLWRGLDIFGQEDLEKASHPEVPSLALEKLFEQLI
jgi:hypothetical protein